MEDANKARNDRKIMPDGEEIGLLPKTLKSSGNYGNANEVGGAVQINITFTSAVGSMWKIKINLTHVPSAQCST